ncbi:universal stress protein [Pararhizobium mangrovi]|uniref:Universal stress protein n=1 Tax=Pararhizobium mangrovi TaxID=2590452 RepID=A0A506U4R7_9HYPH|nr:universal stress protein [Pararhizobium mangrovi]TPW28336.1 universal stress protein [Pararhizobium mangrovi]
MVSQRQSRQEGHRRKFLVIIDGTPENGRAIRYAAMRAKNSNGGLVFLYVIPEGEFQHWLGVEEIMQAEAMEEAEATLAKEAQAVRESIGVDPETVVRVGNTAEQIHALIDEDRDIAILALAAGNAKEGPGPLVSSIAGRGMGFAVPVTVIPAGLEDAEIDALC